MREFMIAKVNQFTFFLLRRKSVYCSFINGAVASKSRRVRIAQGSLLNVNDRGLPQRNALLRRKSVVYLPILPITPDKSFCIATHAALAAS